MAVPGLRQDLRQKVMAIAFSQSGYFTAAQALSVGYTYQSQKYHVDHGNWLRVDRALFRLPHWPPDRDDSYVRWSLWSGGRAVVSHESALAVHELSDIDPVLVHLTVEATFHARDDGVVLHVDHLGAVDVEDRGSWSVTTPVRTLQDVAASALSQEHIDSAVADALRLGRVTRRVLLRVTDGGDPRAALRLERALATAETRP